MNDPKGAGKEKPINTRVQVTLTPEEHQKIQTFAKKDKRSLSSAIAKLAMERLQELEG